MNQKTLSLPASLRSISEIVGGKVIGNEETLILGLNETASAKEGDLVFAWTPTHAKQAFYSKAAAVVTTEEFVHPEKPCLVVSNPRLAMAFILESLFPPKSFPAYISSQSSIDESVQLGERVFVGDFAVVGKRSVIGDDTIIYPHAFIGQDVVIGKSCRIYPFASIYDDVVIGNNVVVHAGAVIGKDGFGFIWNGERHRRIRQIGKVVIEDEVEVGANSCIDSATWGETRIQFGTTIDNLVQIAHNCVLGKHCILAGQTGLSGSVIVGNNVIMGGQVGIVDHAKIGDGVTLLGKTGLIGDVPANTQWAGYPARLRSSWLRVEATLSELPEALRLLRQLLNRIEALERKQP